MTDLDLNAIADAAADPAPPAAVAGLSTPSVELDDDGNVIFNTEYRDKDLVRSIPGATWQKDARIWRAPLSWATCVTARGVFGDRLQIGPRLIEWAAQERANRVDPSIALRVAEDCEIDEPKLFPLQRSAVGFLMTAGSAIEADPMGAGKTVITIRALERMAERGQQVYPALIVCPNSMKRTWKDEFAEWAPNVKVVVVQGGAGKRRKQLAEEADVYVINWESMMRHSKLAGYGYIKLTDKEKEPKELNEMTFGTVVADEAHRAKSPKAKQTRALWAVGDKANHRFALTGTPLANSPTDLWSIARFVEQREFPSKTKYIDRYCLSSWSAFGFNEIVGLRGDTRDELFRFLDPRFIRRPKEMILKHLPPKLPPQTRVVELPSKQRKAYDQLRKDMIAELDSGVLVASNPLKKINRLRQLAHAYGEMLEDGSFRLAEPSCKVDAAIEIAEEMGGEQCLFFAESKQLIQLVANRFEKVGYEARQYTGDVSLDHREVYKKAFMAGDVQFLLLTYGAGGEGLTLTAASTAVKLEKSWSMIKDGQSEDRLHRHGQTERVQVIDVFGEDTVDFRADATVDGKYEKLEEIARDEATLREWLSR